MRGSSRRWIDTAFRWRLPSESSACPPRSSHAPFTCAHPILGVQEKWGQPAITRWFFDPWILAERPRLRRAPVDFLWARTRRLGIDARRGAALFRMLFRGLPDASELVTRVGRETGRS